jgi:hypothetical protein
MHKYWFLIGSISKLISELLIVIQFRLLSLINMLANDKLIPKHGGTWNEGYIYTIDNWIILKTLIF